MAVQRSRSKRFTPSSTPPAKAENSGIFSDSTKGQKMDPCQIPKKLEKFQMATVSNNTIKIAKPTKLTIQA